MKYAATANNAYAPASAQKIARNAGSVSFIAPASTTAPSSVDACTVRNSASASREKDTHCSIPLVAPPAGCSHVTRYSVALSR